jgi:hypothetical protein
MGTNVFIPPPLHALWLPPPGDVSLSLTKFSPFSCLAHSILPGSLRPLDEHRLGMAPSVTPQPEIHLVRSAQAAVPAIRLSIGGCRSQESAALEFVGNSWMGVAVDEAGILIRGARPNTSAAGQMFRLGNCGLLAVSHSMGTPGCCMAQTC